MANKKTLQPGKHTQGLKRGGGRPRKFLTFKEIDFCSYFVQLGVVKAAARYAGIPESTGRLLLTRPLAQEMIAKLQQEYEASTSKRDAIRREQRNAFCHREFIDLIASKKTKVITLKTLELGWRSTTEIPPSHVSAQASVGTAVGLNVIIEHIGRPQDQAAAQAVFAGKTVE